MPTPGLPCVSTHGHVRGESCRVVNAGRNHEIVRPWGNRVALVPVAGAPSAPIGRDAARVSDVERNHERAVLDKMSLTGVGVMVRIEVERDVTRGT